MSIYTIICLLSLASCAWGSCSLGLATTETTVRGTKLIYCNYRGIKLAPGTTVKTVDKCETCTCSKSGLGCCGNGVHAGVIIPPPGCKVVSDACNAVFVDAKNETKPCPIYGSHGVVVPAPPRCKAVSDGCRRLFVDANDVTKLCPE